MGMASKPAASHEPDKRALAHELANLVQALSGNLELLAARDAEDPTRRYLANAQAAAKQLEELIRKLRVEEG